MERVKKILPLLAFSLIPTLLIWLPFYLNLESFWTIPLPQEGMATIVANYDGPLYIVVSKTLYNVQMIKDLVAFPLPAEYYAAHFPLYPLLIRIFAPIFGYPYAMVVVTSLSSLLAIYYFNKLASLYIKGSDLTWLTFVFSVFPARWLIVRSVGSPEPLFLAAIIAAIYYFKKKNYWLTAFFGILAQLTKSPGILLFIALVAAYVAPTLKVLATKTLGEWLKSLKIVQFLPVLLIPLSLIGLFYFYGVRYGDFFAYFNSGDNIHLFFPPFQIFNYSAPWVGTFWLEEVIYIYLFLALGIISLVKQKDYILAWFVAIFTLSLIFVSHRDLMRYSLPVVPFLFLAWRDFLTKREFKIIFIFLLLPIYLFALVYISQNTMPISDWGPLL